MEIALLRRALGAAAVLASGLFPATQAAAECGLLIDLADMPAKMAAAFHAAPEQADPAMRTLAEAQRQLRPEAVASAMADPRLATYETPLMSYARTLQPLGSAALERDARAVETIARSYGVAIGSDLVARLVDQFECDYEVLPTKELLDPPVPAPTGLRGALQSVDDYVPGGRWGAAGGLVGSALLLFGLMFLPRVLKARRRGPWRQRRYDRHACRYTTTLYRREAEHRALVVDISRSGGQVITDVELESLERVLLEIGEKRVAATVKWRGEDFVGLQFETALTPEELAIIVPSGAGPNTALPAAGPAPAPSGPLKRETAP